MKPPRYSHNSSSTTLPWRNIWAKSGLTALSWFNTSKRMAPLARSSSLRSPSDPSLHTERLARRLSKNSKRNSTGPSSWLSPEASSQREVWNQFSYHYAPFFQFKIIYNSHLIGKRESNQQRPRSRTLTSVHEAILEDIVNILANLLTFVIIGVPCHHHRKGNQSDPWWKEAHQS